MDLKLFGKSIFEFNRHNYIEFQGRSALKTSNYLPDFYNDLGINMQQNPQITYALSEADVDKMAEEIVKRKKRKDKEIQITPKGVYEMQLLHDKSFTIKTDEKYIEEKIAEFGDKLKMVKSEDFDMNRGVKEISSLLIRLENRKKYNQFEKFYSQYPYTGNIKIGNVLKASDNLKIGQVAQFVADLPREATEVMKEYTAQTEKLCGKKPVFYIIAEKKDFQKTEQRRDPILLAQSPFGHFWQILGAWDKEMLLLEDL
jgi:hypothetical protein